MKFENMLNTITLGDSYKLIKDIPDKSIDLIITDPPYEIITTGAGILKDRKTRFLDNIQGKFDRGINEEILDDISKLNEIKDTNQVRDELLKLSGVGPKVADCILLFSTLKRFDVFPIDVWVRRVMNDLYIHKEDEKNVSKKEILKLANDKFGNLEGIAQQYLFYWRRELG